MKVKMILPIFADAARFRRRQLKYSLFAPLGLPVLAGYLAEEDQVDFQDEHVESLRLDDDPDVVAIRVCVNSARRAYEIADHYRARGAHVCLGGLHPTALPDEAARHADSVFLGPGEDTWPTFLSDFRKGKPRRRYRSVARTLAQVPSPRRDLLRRDRYLVPNTIVVSRGCPHRCAFCANESFFAGGKRFYTQRVDEALREIDRLPGRHVYFLDDHLFGDRRFASALFDGLRGMGRLWQAAGTVEAVLAPGLLEKAARSGLRSLLIGFETLSQANLRNVGKRQNLHRSYEAAVRRMRDNGVLINGTFVFGLDDDGEDVFDRTVDWAVREGMETATFHILTPYPGTTLHRRMSEQGRMLTRDWDLYDTCHAVFRPRRMTVEQLEAGYHRAYQRFYDWASIFRSSQGKSGCVDRLRHVVYTGGWRRFAWAWHLAIRLGVVGWARPLLESVLAGFGRHSPAPTTAAADAPARAEPIAVPVRASGRPGTRSRIGTVEMKGVRR